MQGLNQAWKAIHGDPVRETAVGRNRASEASLREFGQTFTAQQLAD